MWRAGRISTARLAEMCRRVSMSLEAGLDVRTVWANEAAAASGRLASAIGQLARNVQQGHSVSAAMSALGGFFPPLVVELTAVGEATGHQAEVFAQLADHYEHQLALRRIFLAAIAWPMIQLAIALVVVGFLIWITGLLGQMADRPLDILGLGLTGNRGLAIYLAVVGAAAAAVVFAIYAARRDWRWTAPLRKLVLYVPILGSALHKLALARLAWSLHLALATGMDVRRAVSLGIRSTRNARFEQQSGNLMAQIARGNSIAEVFRPTGLLPKDFLDCLAISEHSGKLVESLAILGRQQQDAARRALARLAMAAGYLVWALVAGLIVIVIFRLYSFYLGTIFEAAGIR